MSRDPLHPGKAAANVGGAALARGAGGRWELADVLSYNSATHTSIVRTHSGRPLRDVPQIKSGPGEFDHLETGSMVVVTVVSAERRSRRRSRELCDRADRQIQTLQHNASVRCRERVDLAPLPSESPPP